MGIRETFFNFYTRSDFNISSCCFALFSPDVGAQKGHGDDRVEYELQLSRLIISIAFWAPSSKIV